MRELFVSRDSLQERLVVENGARSPRPVVVRYEFDADFLDIFEVKSLVFGERDLTFAKRITPLYTARDYDARERASASRSAGDGFPAIPDLVLAARHARRPRGRVRDRAAPRGRWELACTSWCCAARRRAAALPRRRTSGPSAPACASRCKHLAARRADARRRRRAGRRTSTAVARRPGRAAHAPPGNGRASSRPPACRGS